MTHQASLPLEHHAAVATADQPAGLNDANRPRACLVETRQVSRLYQAGHQAGASVVPALVSVSCRVLECERIALVGPSGSGKSTLLHLLGGLDSPSTGTITWPAFGSSENLRPLHVGFVFQMPSLIAPLSVVENVEVPLLLGNASHAVARAAALRALDRLELLAVANKLPEELSGGQAQRVAVARALAYHPALLLADEPTGQLDAPTATHLFDVVLAALEGTPTALVVATHDRLVAARMKTVWQMHHGTLEAN